MGKDRRAFYMHKSADQLGDLPHMDYLERFDPVLIDTCSERIPLFERPKGTALKKLIKDKAFFHLEIRTIDCLGSDLDSVIRIIQELTLENIRLVFRYPRLENFDTSLKRDPTWQTILSIYNELQVAEKRIKMKAHTSGVNRAKNRGLYKGRKKGTTESAQKFLAKPRTVSILQLLKKGATTVEISTRLKCSFSTIDKVRKPSGVKRKKS